MEGTSFRGSTSNCKIFFLEQCPMFEMDHVAVTTKDIAAGVKFYVEDFGAEILYADATWAFLPIAQGKLARVTPTRPPPHVALRVYLPPLQAAALKAGKTIDL